MSRSQDQLPHLMGPLMICMALQVILRIRWAQRACLGAQIQTSTTFANQKKVTNSNAKTKKGNNCPSNTSRSSKDECSTGDQTIILGLQIFLDHRSSRTIDQKILMTLPPLPFLILVVWMSCIVRASQTPIRATWSSFSDVKIQDLKVT